MPLRPREAGGQHLPVHVEQRVEARLLAQGERAGQAGAHNRAVFGVHAAELLVEVVEVVVAADLAFERDEPPGADVVRGDHRLRTGGHVDDEHVSGPLLAERGDLRRAAVVDEAASPHGQAGVLVAERGVLHQSVVDGPLQPGERDERRLVGLRRQRVESAVPDQHPHARGRRRQALERVGHEIAQRRLAEPGGRHQLDPLGHRHDPGPVEHVHVGRAGPREQPPAVDRHRVKRVVVAGQQVNRHLDGGHRLQRPAHGLGPDEVGFEDVARDDDELAPVLAGERPDRPDRIDAGRGVTGLRLRLEEVPGHAQLPVAGVDEADHGHLLRRFDAPWCRRLVRP